MMENDIVDESVRDGDIDDDLLATKTIRQRIRDEFIRDAAATVVLIGVCTWQRKHVDWEIGSSLRDTRLNSRCGFLGILLPTHPEAGGRQYSFGMTPPRLADNARGVDPYAIVYNWANNSNEIRQWIHRAFDRRSETPPNNSRPQFRNNRSGPCSNGWTM